MAETRASGPIGWWREKAALQRHNVACFHVRQSTLEWPRKMRRDRRSPSPPANE